MICVIFAKIQYVYVNTIIVPYVAMVVLNVGKEKQK